ncbi:unnamed protein product [Medioppia subpectinata]|uniref:RRM domain-containing protein n=1 Tax=Medioppia subpectinata TaxID=1979941 RepID=A0A7R9L6S0_9ACAR|nr:unnamed protein product [Medioppia subpectinata]CAG2116551.1 unnamed protein product [Medioppia subpectinata]
MSAISDNRSVFVTDLAEEVTETALLNAFNTCGPIRSVRICRHSDDRRSLGYGYVNFLTASDARQAVHKLNFAQICGQTVKVMAAQSDRTQRVSNNANVFIKNLDKSIDTKRLYELFIPFGPIMSFKLAQEVNGLSKGFGFVQYESEESAVKAIAAMNGKQLESKSIFCSKFLSRSERSKHLVIESDNKTTHLYVKNLSDDFDDNRLAKYFQTLIGSVTSAKVYRKSGKTFGFVSVEDSDVANTAIKALDGQHLANGNTLRLTRVRKVAESLPTDRPTARNRLDGYNVYVRYLDNCFTEKRLREMFAKFGAIASAKVFAESSEWSLRTNQQNRNYGLLYGFVLFTTPEAAQKAVRLMNNALVAKRPVFVSAKSTAVSTGYPLGRHMITGPRNGRQTFAKRLY